MVKTAKFKRNTYTEMERVAMKITNVAPDVIVAGKPCFTRRGLAKALCKSEQTVAAWRSRGFGPPYFSIGRRVLYPEQGVLEWLESTLVTPERKRSMECKKIQRRDRG